MGSSIGFLLLGRLSDLYGRRHIIVGTSLLGVVGCLLGSFAVNAEMLIAANIFNGMAAAAQLPLGVAVAELVPNKDRARTAAGTLVLPFLVAGLGSATIPSLLDDGSSVQWRWGYYTGAFLAFVSFLLYLGLYRPPSFKQLNVAGKTKLEMIKHLDFVGIFLYVSGCVLLPLGFCLGISSYPSVGKEVIGTLVGGFSALVLFVIYGEVGSHSNILTYLLTYRRSIFHRRTASHASKDVQECPVRKSRCLCNFLLDSFLRPHRPLAICYRKGFQQGLGHGCLVCRIATLWCYTRNSLDSCTVTTW